MRNSKGQFIKGNKIGTVALKKWRQNGGEPWNKGISIWKDNHPMLGKTNVSGNKHHNWKGGEVGYRSLHIWVEGQAGKANHCENNSEHFSTRYHWANISGEYKRDMKDWRQLCPSCNYATKIRVPNRFT